MDAKFDPTFNDIQNDNLNYIKSGERALPSQTGNKFAVALDALASPLQAFMQYKGVVPWGQAAVAAALSGLPGGGGGATPYNYMSGGYGGGGAVSSGLPGSSGGMGGMPGMGGGMGGFASRTAGFTGPGGGGGAVPPPPAPPMMPGGGGGLAGPPMPPGMGGGMGGMPGMGGGMGGPDAFQGQLDSMFNNNMIFLMMQTKVQNFSQQFQTISNTMKADADSRLNAIRNFRS